MNVCSVLRDRSHTLGLDFFQPTLVLVSTAAMEIGYTKTGVLFDTAVEDWMQDLQFTEVMNLAMEPCSESEQEITRVLDAILFEVMYGKKLAEPLQRLTGQTFKMIRGRQANKGEQLLNTAMGNAIDGVFKNIVTHEVQSGGLKQYNGRLTITPAGAKGPDVYMRGSPMIAWDVTTRGAASDHIQRDNFGRGWNRYYLLIWDEPGIGFNRGGSVQRLPRRV